MENDHDEKNQAKQILAALDKLIGENEWDSSLFLKTMGTRLRKLRQQAAIDLGLDNHTLEEVALEGSQTDHALVIADSEKIVYARLYHKKMDDIPNPVKEIPWLAALLATVVDNERRGVAIYASEEHVKASIKNEHYCYILLRINYGQDITKQRPAKQDPLQECDLLVIKDIESNQMLKLVHKGVSYDLKDGKLLR